MEPQVLRMPSQFSYSYHKTFGEESAALLASGATHVDLDFSRVEYLDSSALGMLVLFNKKAQEKNIKVSIVGAKGAAEEILKMANMQKLFNMS